MSARAPKGWPRDGPPREGTGLPPGTRVHRCSPHLAKSWCKPRLPPHSAQAELQPGATLGLRHHSRATARSSLPSAGMSSEAIPRVAALFFSTPAGSSQAGWFSSPPRKQECCEVLLELINQLSFGTEPAVLWWRWKDRVAHAGPEARGSLGSDGGIPDEFPPPKGQGGLGSIFQRLLASLSSQRALPTKKHKAMVNYFACSGTLPTLSYSAVLFSL